MVVMVVVELLFYCEVLELRTQNIDLGIVKVWGIYINEGFSIDQVYVFLIRCYCSLLTCNMTMTK